MKYYLAVAYEEKDELKKVFSIKFDGDLKAWYYETDTPLPKDLEAHVETPVDIPYDDKDLLKTRYNTLRWKPSEKTWVCSAKHAERIM